MASWNAGERVELLSWRRKQTLKKGSTLARGHAGKRIGFFPEIKNYNYKKSALGNIIR
jgi:hypothetical protein